MYSKCYNVLLQLERVKDVNATLCIISHFIINILLWAIPELSYIWKLNDQIWLLQDRTCHVYNHMPATHIICTKFNNSIQIKYIQKTLKWIGWSNGIGATAKSLCSLHHRSKTHVKVNADKFHFKNWILK